MKILLYILLVLPLSGRALAEDASVEAQNWLDKMVNAVKTLNYEGTFVYIHDNQLEAMHIIHQADSGGEHERLLSLNGAAREILRDNDLLTCILPDSRSVVVEKSRPRKYIPEGLLHRGKGLSEYYDFEVLGQDRMTGRKAQVVAVKPRDGYRYGYKLWLDDETGMLLKSDLLDEDGQAVEQVMFTSLTLHDRIDESQLKPAISGKGFKWFRQESPPKDMKSAPRLWKVTRLPDGYMMTMKMEHALPISPMPLEHMVFTDGLSSVSVYIERLEPGEKMLKGSAQMGAVHAYGRLVAGHQVTVMGEVPEATVVMIGDSVRYSPSGKPE